MQYTFRFRRRSYIASNDCSIFSSYATYYSYLKKTLYAGNVRVLGICILARYLSGLWLVAFLGTVYILLLVKSMRVSDASSATNISGMSQGYYLDVSLLDNVTLYDSFVPVEFGRFNGGVIDAKIKRFNADDSKVKLGYRTTRSDWLTSHIDENNKSAFITGVRES